MNSPRDLHLPYDDWRPGQRLAIRTALHAKTMHTVINAPTGSGKSTIAAALMRLDPGRTVMLTASKQLERQYLGTFPWLTNIHGMANYECLLPKDDLLQIRKRSTVRMCDDGPCRRGVSCDLKNDGCLYFDAYRNALGSDHVLTNYAYWLAIRRFGKGLGMTTRLVLDEAHALPEELMSAYRIEIPLALVRAQRTLPRTWREWTHFALSVAASLNVEAGPGGSEDGRAKKQRLVDSLKMLSAIDETWAWDVLDTKVVFEPTIPKLLMPMLAGPSTARHIVYLSATITPSTLRLLDIPTADTTFRTMKSRFPVARRPTYLVECTRVDHKMSIEQRTWWLSRIDKIIAKRLDRKGIIHTVSYQRAFDIVKASAYRGLMLAPTRASELATALERFRTAPAPMILLSPSISTGVDFPYKSAEYQIIAKMPFPDTRSTIVKARIEATEGYRDHLTAQALVQATGRVMRAEDDQGETFILDDHARWFIPKAREQGLLPEWFLESLVWIGGRGYSGPEIPLPPPALT